MLLGTLKDNRLHLGLLLTAFRDESKASGDVGDVPPMAPVFPPPVLVFECLRMSSNLPKPASPQGHGHAPAIRDLCGKASRDSDRG